MATPGSAGEPVDLIDDDTTASSVGDDQSFSSAIGKRKFEEPEDVWADEPSDLLEEFKQKQKRKRARTGMASKARKGTAEASSKGNGKAAVRRSGSNLDDSVKNADESNQEEDDLAAIYVPDHIRERRKQFDENVKILRDSGLKLPPDYRDVYFSDEETDPMHLERRPKFDNIKPCRPCEDIMLNTSAGLIPASIAQYLRDYQVDGVRFLHEHFVRQTGCILGDDMGLGKTVQVAAFLTAAFGKMGDSRDAKRMRKMTRLQKWYPCVLVVCPGSLIENWKIELNRWGRWKVELYHGGAKGDVLRAARSGALEVMITTYDTYRNDHEKINLVDWDAVVADECHKIKEPRSAITKTMGEVNALCRIGLTGTAIQNKYEELWTLLNWANPGYFGSLMEWRTAIVTPLTRGQSHDATLQELSLARKTAKKLVQNLLPAFFLRRMKSLIADQLPKKSDRVVFCPLTNSQRDAYENFRDSEEVDSILSSVEICQCGSGKKQGWCCGKILPDGRTWMALVFPAILALQKLSNHLTLLIPPDSEGNPDKRQSSLKILAKCVPKDWKQLYQTRNSVHTLANPEYCGKWKILRKLLSFWHDNGDKVLVFSHSVRLLQILNTLFKSTSYTVRYLDGTMSYEDRQREVDNFNADPDSFVFLISTKAGGIGLNIASANKVVIFDPHWNPSYDLQAQDRAYRIGQVRDVEVFRLISAGTIEEIVYARQIYKQQQANIGYNASSERRYFKGVQQDKDRKGELFGLKNLFSFRADQVVLRDIVNKTNIAEARAGVSMLDIDMDNFEKDDEFGHIKKEDVGEDDGGLSQLAALIKTENPEELLKKNKPVKPKSDAIQAILAAAGVEYTHENSEVIGSSKVEAQLSRRAELAENTDLDPEDQTALFVDRQASDELVDEEDGDVRTSSFTPRFKPPLEVMRRQFCTMAREFDFGSAQDFALAVEAMTQEQRRNCLDLFYKKRMTKLLNGLRKGEDADEKVDVLNVEGGVPLDACAKTEEGVKNDLHRVLSETIKKEEESSMVKVKDAPKWEVKAESQDKHKPAAVNQEEDCTTIATGAAAKTESCIFIYDSDDDDEL